MRLEFNFCVSPGFIQKPGIKGLKMQTSGDSNPALSPRQLTGLPESSIESILYRVKWKVN